MVVDNNGHTTSLEIQDGQPKQTKINRTKIAATVILGTLVLGFIILGSVLLTGQPFPKPGEANYAAQRRNIRGIDLDEVLSQQLSSNDFNGTFVSGTEILYRNRNGDIVLFNIESKSTDIILPGNHPSQSASVSYTLSPDRKYLLMAHYRQKLYRYSFIGSYDIVDLSTKVSVPLTSSDGFRLHLLATWGPVDNALVFVSHNTHDIYYKPSVNAEARRLTRTGVSGIIYNGVPDWVNEEEVVGSNKAMWWSPDGNVLAYASYNDSATRIMSIPYYGIPGHLDFQYTRAVNIRYPKPGTANPITSLYIVKLDQTSTPVELPPPAELKGSEPILTTVVWISSEQLLAIWLNRIQNESFYVVCSATTLNCRNILELKEPKGWITTATPKSIANGTKIAMILPQTQEVGGQFRQVCLGEMGDNGEYNVRPLTSGAITVSDIINFNEKTQKIIYEAVDFNSPEARHTYEIELAEGSQPKCITCNIRTRLQKKSCLYNEVTFSSGDAYVHSCLGPGVPEISVRDGNHNKIVTWEDNRQIYEDVRSRQMPIVERFKVKVPGGFEAAVALHLPPDIDRSGDIKYPLLIHVYGGPDSSQSSERFTIDWNVYLAVNKSVIVASIDGRGSGNKGNDMLFSVYRNLGNAEIDDQISVTNYLQNSYSYIDKKRTAIWGWSYGGYATTMALIRDRKNVFKCGIAIAPVSDWSLYDTIYAERYMGLPRPGDNLQGYATAALNDKVENLRNKEFFLIHGTLDDNVHYQQSMLLAKSLEQHDILFRQQSYVDEDHGLGGVRPHLFHSLDKFLDECFNLNEIR